MTAHMPPPTVSIQQDGAISRAGELTQSVVTKHVAAIKTSLTSVEEAIANMPEGDAKRQLQFRILRLHNTLGRGGQSLNDHFQTAQVSPDSSGGDKDGGSEENVPPTTPLG